MDKKCRTCSRNDQFEGISVKAISSSHQEPIYLMLIYCAQLQYSTNDTFPQQICPDCLVLLEGAFTFWKQCRQTDMQRNQLVPSLVQEVPPESAAAETRKTPQILSPPVQESPPGPEAPAPAETSSAPQKFWCCFRKCTKEAASMADLEQHAKLDHFAARVANEVIRAPDHEVVCSVCCAGFKLLGSYEFHRLTLDGTMPKPCTSARVSNEKQQQQPLQDDEPMDDLEAVEATVVKEELELDDWPENIEETGMECTAEESKIDEDHDETIDDQALEEQGIALYDILMKKLTEALATSKGHFQIPLTKKMYHALRQRGLHWNRFRNTAINRYKKWLRLIITCERCKFQTNIHTTMQKHAKKRACQASTMSYALATYESSTRTLVCVPCGYETSLSYNIRRHQRLFGHEGIDLSKSETTTKKDMENDVSTSSPEQLDIVSVKEEPYFSEDDESLLDAPPENGQEKLDCTHCGTEISSDAEKQRHLVCECPVLHSKAAGYTCEHCKVAVFPFVKDLRNHVRTNCPALQDVPIASRNIVPKKCDKCNKTFSTGELFSRHIPLCTTTEKDKETFSCKTCGTHFQCKYSFERHLKDRTCLKDPNQCKKCFTTFSEASALKRHRKVGCPALLNVESSGLKPTCNCDRCGKGFITKRMLRVHKLTDGCGGDSRRAAKPAKGKVQCPYCFTQHSRPSNLKRHLEVHCVILLKKQAEADHAAAQGTGVAGTEVT